MVFIASIIGSFAAGAIGSLATTPNIPTWYAALAKPPLNPPNWIFGPVWSTLYLLIGIALALVILELTKHSKKRAYFWFGLQLTLNAMWSLVFFFLHSPGLVWLSLLHLSLVL